MNRRMGLAALVVVWMGAIGYAQPTTRMVDRSPTLSKGQLQFDPPPGWVFAGRSEDDLAVAFQSGDREASLQMNVTPHQSAIPQSAKVRQDMAQQVVIKLKQAQAEAKNQVVMEPTVEADPRLLVKVHQRYKAQGIFVDQVLAMRVVGRSMLLMVSYARTEDQVQARTIHEQTLDALMSVRPGTGRSTTAEAGDEDHMPDGATSRQGGATSRPTGKITVIDPSTRPIEPGKTITFAKAQIRLATPAGWKVLENDAPSGVIATLRNPQSTSDLMMISVRPLPAEAGRDPENRRKIAEQLALGEKAAFKPDKGEATGEPEVLPDPRFVRKTRTKYDAQGLRFWVESRQILAGNALVGVTSLTTEDRADLIGQAADDLATGVKAVGERERP